MKKIKAQIISQEEFNNKLNITKNHLDELSSFDGKLYTPFGEELAYVEKMAKNNKVITVMEDRKHNIHYVSGIVVDNRLGFMVVEDEITEEFNLIIG